MTSITHRRIPLGDVTLHVAEAGEPGAPLVLLLHGFPEFWYGWRHQLPALAAAGFHVVAPDLRGYNESDRPARVRDYRIELLARDVARLVDALGHERAHVVGHDWGGGVAWAFACRYPERLDRLVVVNAVHPVRALAAWRMPRQWLRSSYMLFFQLPWLPERVNAAFGCWLPRRGLERDPLRPDAFTADDIARYLAAWSQPGAWRGGISYYRAAFRGGRRFWRVFRRPIPHPTLVIWGEHDRFQLPELASPPAALVPNCRVARLAASHWVPADAPEEVNRLLVSFLRDERG